MQETGTSRNNRIRTSFFLEIDGARGYAQLRPKFCRKFLKNLIFGLNFTVKDLNKSRNIQGVSDKKGQSQISRQGSRIEEENRSFNL